MMKTKLFYLLVFLHEALFGQIVPDDISRMKNKMESMTNYSCDIQYKLYSRTIASPPIEVKSGFLLHNNQNSLFEIGELITINTSKYLIKVDTIQKIISVANANRQQQNDFDLNKYLEGNFDIEYEGAYNTNKVYRYKPQQLSTLQYLNIYIDTATFLLNKIVLFYNLPNVESSNGVSFSSPVIEITYSNYVQNRVTESMVDEENYLHFKEDEITPSGRYSNYQIYKLF